MVNVKQGLLHLIGIVVTCLHGSHNFPAASNLCVTHTQPLGRLKIRFLKLFSRQHQRDNIYPLLQIPKSVRNGGFLPWKPGFPTHTLTKKAFGEGGRFYLGWVLGQHEGPGLVARLRGGPRIHQVKKRAIFWTTPRGRSELMTFLLLLSWPIEGYWKFDWKVLNMAGNFTWELT